MVYETWPIVQSESNGRKDMLKRFPHGTNQNDIWIMHKRLIQELMEHIKIIGWWLNNDQSSNEE